MPASRRRSWAQYLEPEMTALSINWPFDRLRLAAGYRGWGAHLGLIAAFALAFAIVLLSWS
jgi:hypothetical protein